MRFQQFYDPTDLTQTAGRMALSATRIEFRHPYLCVRDLLTSQPQWALLYTLVLHSYYLLILDLLTSADLFTSASVGLTKYISTPFLLLLCLLCFLTASSILPWLGEPHTAYPLFPAGFALPAYMFSGSKEYRHPLRYLSKNTETPAPLLGNGNKKEY